MIYVSKIIEALEKITGFSVSNSILLKPNGKNKTILFTSFDENGHAKKMKATLKHECLISNIRPK